MPESVNQKIRKALNRGDMAKLANLLKMSHQNVTQKIKSEKEIDSIDFIIAVSKITGKPIEYFKPAIYEVLDSSRSLVEASMVTEEDVSFGDKQLSGDEQKILILKKRLAELEIRVTRLETKFNN